MVALGAGAISRVPNVKTMRNSCAQTFMGAMSEAGCSICGWFCSTQFSVLNLSGNESLSRHFPRYACGGRRLANRSLSDGVKTVYFVRCASRSSCKGYVCRSATVAGCIMQPQILIWQSSVAKRFGAGFCNFSLQTLKKELKKVDWRGGGGRTEVV